MPGPLAPGPQINLPGPGPIVQQPPYYEQIVAAQAPVEIERPIQVYLQAVAKASLY